MIQANERIGKFIQWDNGLRLFVIGHDEKYPNDFRVQYAIDHGTNEYFAATAANVAKGKIIPEEEAKRQYAEITINKPQTAFCCCGSWRIGRDNVSIKFDLKDGKIPQDELYRIDKLLKPFIELHHLALRLHPTDTGIELEFFSMKV